jgi:hypothetical protein
MQEQVGGCRVVLVSCLPAGACTHQQASQALSQAAGGRWRRLARGIADVAFGNSRVSHAPTPPSLQCSIMIGTALDAGQMQRILARLATLQAPWNCPHGRPTMRHLCTLPDGGDE